MQWSGEHRAFTVETFFSNGRSVIATQRAFRTQLNIRPGGRVPGRQPIVSWVEQFRERFNVLPRPRVRQRPARTPENVDAVRQSFLRSPRRSARKHAAALGISDRSVRRILHSDLKFHPYKCVVSVG